MLRGTITDSINYYTCPTLDKPLVYVIRGEKGDLIIDTGRKHTAGSVEKWINDNGFDIKYLLLTHGHFDHTWNAKEFKEKYGLKIILHEKDLSLYEGDESRQLVPSSHFRIDATGVANRLLTKIHNPVTDIDYLINDNDSDLLRQFGFDAEIVPLPGHTIGSVGVRTGDILYSGDACSIVGGDYHTTFFGEDKAAIYETEERMLSMNLRIIAPGHGRLLDMDMGTSVR